MSLISSLFPILISILVWVIIFILIKPRRIQDLLPVGVLNLFYFFLISSFLKTTGLAFYTPSFLPHIGNTPIFALIWAAGAAILMINFINQNLSRKLFIILIFTIIALVVDVASIIAGTHVHSPKYSFIHSFFFMFAGNATFVIIAEALFKNRIHII